MTHRPSIRRGALAACLAFATVSCQTGGGATPPPVGGRCVEFETLVPGTVYQVGDGFSEAGVTVTLAPFEWSSGNVYQDGKAEVGISGQAGGSGLELEVNNVLVEFGQIDTELVTLRFAELGGNVNLTINGDKRNFHNLSAVNGNSIGGAFLTVVNGFGNDSGTVRIEGRVETLSIGGQEFWLDDVCFTP